MSVLLWWFASPRICAAPANCLQYFTGSSGTVKSFNWVDVAATTRQLANQDYKICFRTEVVSSQKANKLCFATCTLTNGGNAFAVSGTTAANSQATVAACNNDFLIVEGGYDPTKSLTLPANTWDRYCGTAFNTDIAGTTSATVCSNSRLSFVPPSFVCFFHYKLYQN